MMRTAPAIGLLLALVAGVAAGASCSSKEAGCRPGDVQACTCEDPKTGSTPGSQACGGGHVFGTCRCGTDQPNQPGGPPTPPPTYDAAVDGAPPPENAPKPRGPSGEVSIGAGKFTMGCDGCRDDAKPAHEVTLTAYSIDKTEVSQSEYKKCVDGGGCKAPGGTDCAFDPAARGDFPVVCVTWDEAKAYCASVSKRLPTEAEWERAARGTGPDERQLYPWSGLTTLDCDHANFFGIRGCELPATDVVGVRPDGASPDGVLDMAGNVWEWVADLYDGGYYAKSPPTDPKGPSSGSEHVIRGGAFRSGTESLETTYRDRSSGGDRSIGFRCAK